MNNFCIFCECYSPQHCILVYCSQEDSEVVLTFKLTKPSLWTRIKYLFGWSEWSGYAETILTAKHIPQLKAIIDCLSEK